MASLTHLELLPNDVQFGMILEETENDSDYEDEYQPRQRNLGKVQHRKFTGYDQRLPMVIYGFREETVHGTSADGVPHTLIVFRWGLQQRRSGRRFKSATIKAVFQTMRKKPGGGGFDAFYDPRRSTPMLIYPLLSPSRAAPKPRPFQKPPLRGGA